MAKKYDLVVKVGEYTDGQGQTKGRFKNVGVVMDGQNGPYILLDRTFNPAGVGGNDSRESIIISMYEPKQEGGQPAQQRSGAPSQRPAPAPLDDDVPF
jgi:hypothetical protein